MSNINNNFDNGVVSPVKPRGKYYITTPIYYPSANLHVGHTYCTVMADAMARFKRLQGYDVRFLTGTDEHGQKIQQIAEKAGMKPIEYTDMIVEGIIKLWEKMEISYDDFIRTTEDRHVKRVQEIFKKLYEKGDIYKGEYEGMYCAPCEAFWTETQLNDGKCPDCGRDVTSEKEEAYFFKLSKYQDALEDLFVNNPAFLEPDARRNEMLSFVRQGLDDLCISRSSFDWGIPVPLDEKHVIYVWLDALSNYITALGYPDDTDLYNKYWPADVHLVGKEIVRFHSIIWPAMLMSLDIPLPKQVLGHGWLLIDGRKMSKSSGNVVDPILLIERYGVDALKYFLLREYTFGQDGVFTNETMLRRINSDLANDLGNLLSRTISMIEKYCDGVIPEIPHICRGDVCKMGFEDDELDMELKKIAVEAGHLVEAEMDKFSYSTALEQIWVLVRRANKYIDETMPWVLGKSENEEDSMRLSRVMNRLAESLRIISILIYPFMHTSAAEMRTQLGIGDQPVVWEDAFVFDMIGGSKVKKGENLFNTFDIEKEKEALAALSGADISPAEPAADAAEKNNKAESEQTDEQARKAPIEFDDFDKIDLRVGVILEAEKHPDADKLLVFKLKVGSEVRQVISGVAAYFDPAEMVGKKVILVANLKPRKLRGLESNGMLLFADNGERVEIVTTDAEDGNRVS